MSEGLRHEIAAFALDPVYQLAALLLMIMVARIAARGHLAIRFAANIVFFTLLTIVLVADKVAPWAVDYSGGELARSLFVGVAKAIWWIGGAMVLVSSVRLFLIFEREPREGRLVQDLLAGAIYLGAGLAVVAYVFRLPVGTLIATSGAIAIVLGLALQSTLNDVFSGIALNLNRVYKVGDWIALEDGTRARVVETNWRSTKLLSKTNDLVIVPNSGLAKARLVNLTGADEAHGSTITVRLLPTAPPAAVEDAMQSVLLSANTILKSPSPTVAIIGLDACAVQVELAFRVENVTLARAAKNEIYDLVYRHARAAGLKLGAPAEASTIEVSQETKLARPGTAWRLLTDAPLFATLTEPEKDTLASVMQRLTFKKNTIIVAEDTSMTSLMLVRSGVVIVERRVGDAMVEMTRLAPGDLFGESGVLLGAAETTRMRALTFVVVYEISKDHLKSVMRERPVLAEELGALLAERHEKENSLLTGSRQPIPPHRASFTARIRHLFDVPTSVP